MPSTDLRAVLLPVRNQERRRSCLAFASSTAHERQSGQGEHLSVEYLYYHCIARTPGKDPAAGTTMMAAAAALAEDGQPIETAWPYSPVQIDPWTPPAITTALHKATMVRGALDFDELIAVIDQGQPVILGLVITDFFYQPDRLGRIPDETPDIERGGHAVLAVGHGADSDGVPLLLIRNSWGEGWGNGGYGWLPRPYIKRQLRETALII